MGVLIGAVFRLVARSRSPLADEGLLFGGVLALVCLAVAVWTSRRPRHRRVPIPRKPVSYVPRWAGWVLLLVGAVPLLPLALLIAYFIVPGINALVTGRPDATQVLVIGSLYAALAVPFLVSTSVGLRAVRSHRKRRVAPRHASTDPSRGQPDLR